MSLIGSTVKVRKHGDNLFELTRFGWLLPISCYFVREEDGVTLIDSGMSKSGRSIVKVADEIGQPIVRVVLTHAHSDHAGSWDELATLVPDAERLVSTREARLLAGEMDLDPDEPQAKLRGSYLTSNVRPTRLLDPGDRVGSLEVIAAPGHTPGQIAFFDHRDRALIAGDAFQTRGGIAVASTMRFLLPFPAMATWHKPTALATARKLRDLEPSRLAVGHGKVLDDPVSSMDKAIDEAARKLGEDVARVA